MEEQSSLHEQIDAVSHSLNQGNHPSQLSFQESIPHQQVNKSQEQREGFYDDFHAMSRSLNQSHSYEDSYSQDSKKRNEDPPFHEQIAAISHSLNQESSSLAFDVSQQTTMKRNDDYEQIRAISRSLNPETHSQYENTIQQGNKKRVVDDDRKSKQNEDVGDSSKKIKTVGYSYNNQSQEDHSLESITQGTVPDMSTVASSIAALSAQPSPPGWAFMVPSSMANTTSNTLTPQMYQQLLLQQQYMYNMQREMHSQIERDNSRFSERGNITTPNNIFTSQEGNGMFMILEQPNEVQRKSYKNENRCLLPNPITICQKEFIPEDKRGQIPMDGTVTVSLVDQDGEELPPSKANMLDSIERSTTQPLDENFTAQFSLKVLETSEGNMVRLLFTVNYRLKNLGQCQEKILSRPFVVYSNRKKHVKVDKDKPILIDIKPSRGEFNKETEVWIKGRGFNEKVIVNFGDRPAKVIDTSENLVTVVAPVREDLLHGDQIVEVSVSNKFAREQFASDKKLNFTYTSAPLDLHRAVAAALLPQPSLEPVIPPLDNLSHHDLH